MKKGPAMMDFADLGFKDKASWTEFQSFLTKYLAFTSDIMELILSLASLKCFSMEPCHRHNEMNLLQRLEKMAAEREN